MSQRPTIRFASADEGYVVRDILAAGDSALASLADWTVPLGPYWLLAITDRPIACLMVNPGTPVGRMEHLSTLNHLRHRDKALAVWDLLCAGMATLHANGSQFAASYIPNDLQAYQRLLVKRGGVPMEQGTFFMKRL